MNLIENPEVDPLWQGLVIAHESGCRWIAVRMLFNHRLMCVPDGGLGDAAYGWCYPSLPALVASAAAFDPDTQDEPVGWHKRPGANTRRAPHRDQDPEHNQPRCVHGSYLHTLKCQHAAVCPEILNHRTRETT
ncbi:hypothetical protein [Streptomyces sp. Amel2xC10]|uniref:hypothetical protein n=1 Tax=Streptomyces sp. Amel2xC10 TaxID=1305826 RepID=UPI000A0911A0|nr:hypothetical protein [Streptomyces sp. Amel2xC10]SMF86379.1 hypothetical protein SAMN02745830_07158 [Streptomyces sp. Amel2xC10]